jgi:hypothetical protein
MISIQKVRGLTGIILIVVFSITANAQLFRAASSFRHPSAGQDPISLYEKRFTELKKDIPKNVTIGYITDVPPGNILTLTNSWSIEALYMAQYSMAPIVTEIGTDRSLVLGNFHIPRDLTTEVSAYKLSLIKDYGNGVFLFGKENK